MRSKQPLDGAKCSLRAKALSLIAAIAFAFLAVSIPVHATTYYSAYGQNRTETVNLSSTGTHMFEVDGIASYKYTEWYVNTGSGYVYKNQTDDSGFWAIDPDYSYTFSGGTTAVKAIVYNNDWTVKEAHVWNVTIDTTAPSIPLLNSPTANSVTSDNTVFLDWSDSTDSGTGVAGYEVQVDDSNSFSSPNYSTTSTASSATTSALADGLYYWRTRAKDNAGNWSGWSSTSTFRVDTTPPSTPNLFLPNNGSSTHGQRPQFVWTDSTDFGSGLSHYDVEVYDGDPTWGDISTTTSDATFTPNADIPFDRIYWKVRAVDKAGNASAWSTEFWFDLINHLPTQPGTITPSAVTSDSARIDWVASSDQDGDTITYEIQYGVNNTLGWVSGGTTTGTSTSIAALQPETTYVARVRASDGKGGISSWQELDPAFTTKPAHAIVSAYWLAPNYITEGTTATMRAQVSGYAVGDQLQFEIREDNGLFGFQSVTTKTGKVYSDGGKFYVDATWTSVWQSDVSGDPEYYFVVSGAEIQAQSSTADLDELHVAKGPELSVTVASLTPTVAQGQNAQGQNFAVWNSGNGTLSYTITSSESWLSVNPLNGASSGEHDSATVSYVTAGLSAGTYNGAITVAASGARSSPQTISVELTVEPPLSSTITGVSFDPPSDQSATVDQVFPVQATVSYNVATAGYLQVWIYDSDFGTSQMHGQYISGAQNSSAVISGFSLVSASVGTHTYTVYVQFRPGAPTGPLLTDKIGDVISSSTYVVNWQTGPSSLTDSQKQSLILQMVNNYRGVFPPELVLAVICQEGTPGAFHVDGSPWKVYRQADGPWAQPYWHAGTQARNYDGVMQVTPINPFHQQSGPYSDTQAGYDNAIHDGSDNLISLYQTYGTLWESVLHYNTGQGTLIVYKTGAGDQDYLTHVASNLRGLVHEMYGMNNTQLADQLDAAQTIVNKYLNNPSILANQIPSYYKIYQSQLDAELQNLGNTSTKIITLNGDLKFGNVLVGNPSRSLRLTLANNGTTSLAVSGVNYPNGFTGSWSSGIIAPGHWVNIDVTFTPTAAIEYSANLTFNSDKTSGSDSIPVLGIGVNTQPITYDVVPSADVNGSIDPNTTQTVNDSGAVSFAATPADGFAVDQWMVDNVPVQAAGQTFTLANVTAPASVQVTFAAISQTGSLQANLSPLDAVEAGALWQVDGGPWRSTGESISGLSVGGHTVTFNSISGWATPDAATITVEANQTTKVSGTYVTIPQLPKQLTETTLSNGMFHFTLNGPVGSNYVVKVSSNLVNWSHLFTIAIPTSGLVLITDTNFFARSRFYRASPTVITNMSYIPSGPFQMGNSMDPNEGFPSELPVHTVNVSGFYMDQYEVTKGLWDDVYAWAVTNGYSFANPGSGKGPTHPVQTVNWYDIVKWCNARSEKEGFTPLYYTDDAHTSVYRSGIVDVNNAKVNWTADGYRLPTEAEWEKAARGGLTSRRNPWGDTITHSQANYYSHANNTQWGDISPTRGYNPTYAVGDMPYTSPVGSFEANGFGLYDMGGNVWEYCWDWNTPTYYSNSPANDPLGASTGSSNKAMRGGSWRDFFPRVAGRFGSSPYGVGDNLGFRCVRR